MDVYRISVTIDMVNNASAVLGVIQRDVLGLQKSVDTLTSGFTAAKAAAAGLNSVLTSGAVLGGIGGLARQQVLVQGQSRDILATSLTSIAGTETNATAGALTTINQAGRSNVAENLGDVLALLGPLGRSPVVPDDLTSDTKAAPGARIEDRSIDLMSMLAATGSSPKLNSATPLDVMVAGLSASTKDWSSTFNDAILRTRLRPPNTGGRNISPGVASDQQPAFQGSVGYAKRDDRPGTETSALDWRAKAYLLDNHDTLQVMTRFAAQQARFDTDPSLNHSASGMGAYDALAQDDPSAKIKSFQETWKNLVTALGAPLVNTGTTMMVSLTHAMDEFTQGMVAHPELVGAIGKTVAALAGLVAEIGLFATGATAATALGFLTGASGLIGLATGIERLGKVLPSIPAWLAQLSAGTAAGPAVGSVARGIGAPGAMGVRGIALPNAGSTNDLHTRASYIPDGTGDAWLPGGESAVPPSASSTGPSGPVPVYVVNGRDIAEGTTAHQTAQLSAPPVGPTGGDPRMNLPMPAFGTIVGL